MPLAEALIAAHERGVRVRMVTETDYLDERGTQALAAAGIPVVDDRNEDLMHDKFVVVDGAEVWTGSMNFTHSDAYRNNNTVIYIESTRLAENYTREFEEMFEDHVFGSISPDDTPNPVVTVNGTRIENYFSPDDGVAAHLLEVLEGAEHSIYFMAFAFTRQDMAQVLLDQAAAGLDVRGVFETRQVEAGANQAWLLLTEGGLADSVRQDGNRYNMHSKVFIIDEAVVVLGSYNFSNNAERRNDENILFIYNPTMAQAMLAEWHRIWAEAE
jgi:phosphatidylserine/phosphatidylglycerophosphate/cardiolipin synthase-like enzyme